MNEFHEKIEKVGDELILEVYRLTRKFPDEEKYALTQQLRRAATSIMLNYIEGRAKRSDKNYGNHINSSYGSLKEVLYTLKLSVKLGYIQEEEVRGAFTLGDELSAMIYTLLRELRNI